MANQFEKPPREGSGDSSQKPLEQINQPVPSITVEKPSTELLEKAQQDPRVHYVPSLAQIDLSEHGGTIMDAPQYYHAWKSGKVESHKARTFTFGEFVMEPLQRTLQQDLAEEFPVSIRGVGLNIGETINSGQPNEVLGISDVLKLNTERRERTGTKIPTLRYGDGDRFPDRSEQWLEQSPRELRNIVGPTYKDQIFPAVLVYKAGKPEIIGIYIVDHLNEQKGK